MCSIRVRFRQSPERRGVFNYALLVEVIHAEGMPSKIFVYHQMPAGIDGNTYAEFDHIATPVDFQEIPEDAASDTVPWYRTDKCTVWTRSVSDIELAKQLFIDDITALKRTYNTLTSVNNFVNQTTLDFNEDDVHIHTETEDVIDLQKEIDALNRNKMDKNAMSNETVYVKNIEGMRDALITMAEILGATVERPDKNEGVT